MFFIFYLFPTQVFHEITHSSINLYTVMWICARLQKSRLFSLNLYEFVKVCRFKKMCTSLFQITFTPANNTSYLSAPERNQVKTRINFHEHIGQLHLAKLSFTLKSLEDRPKHNRTWRCCPLLSFLLLTNLCSFVLTTTSL